MIVNEALCEIVDGMLSCNSSSHAAAAAAAAVSTCVRTRIYTRSPAVIAASPRLLSLRCCCCGYRRSMLSARKQTNAALATAWQSPIAGTPSPISSPGLSNARNWLGYGRCCPLLLGEAREQKGSRNKRLRILLVLHGLGGGSVKIPS